MKKKTPQETAQSPENTQTITVPESYLLFTVTGSEYAIRGKNMSELDIIVMTGQLFQSLATQHSEDPDWLRDAIMRVADRALTDTGRIRSVIKSV